MKKLLIIIMSVCLFCIACASAEDTVICPPDERAEALPVLAAGPESIPPSEAELSLALEANAFHSGRDFLMPMLTGEKDGRLTAYSSNAGMLTSVSCVNVQLDAVPGDAVCVTFKTDTEAAADIFAIQLNGETVKLFSGCHDWMTYAVPVETDGSITLSLYYAKNASLDAGEDAVWIDSVKVLSGEAAERALSANPLYPTAEEITLAPAEGQAREIAVRDEHGVLESKFAAAGYYLADTDTVTVRAALTDETDPEGAFFMNPSDGSFVALSACRTETGYETVLTLSDDSCCTSVMLSLDPSGRETRTAVFFRNEESLRAFLSDAGLSEWSFKNVKAPASPQPGFFPVAEAAYTIRCVDQNGAPVNGVMVQICDESTCRVAVTDANGLHTFTSVPCAWEIHVLIAPEGYSAASDARIAPVNGGEITLTLQKS